jgi:hypothetical protein
MEFGIALFTSLIGYGIADLGDRYLAAGKAASLTQAMGTEAGPMDWKRWLLGLGLTAAPMVLAHYGPLSRNAASRATLQGLAIGAGLRTLGKGFSDMAAKLTEKTDLGQRLYAGENAGRAYIETVAAETRKAQGTGKLPAKKCAECGKSDGLGACCRSSYAGAPHRMDSPGMQPQTPPRVAEPPISVPNVPPVVSMTPPVARIPPGGGDGGGGEIPVPPAEKLPQVPTSSLPVPPASPPPPASMYAPSVPSGDVIRVNGLPPGVGRPRMHMPNYAWAKDENKSEDAA